MLATPFALLVLFCFVLPVALTVTVSFWDSNEYEVIPTITWQNYARSFSGCVSSLPVLCTTVETYLRTLKVCLPVWLVTLPLAFAVAYFLCFHVRTRRWRHRLAMVCLIPFATPPIARIIALTFLLRGSNAQSVALPVFEMSRMHHAVALSSEATLIITFVHLYALVMLAPILYAMSRIERPSLQAAGVSRLARWRNVIIPATMPWIVLGSVMLALIVIGDFMTYDLIGGGHHASMGQAVAAELSFLQFPAAAAKAVSILATTAVMLCALWRLVHIDEAL